MSITQDEINSFPLSRKAGFESPSDQLITLTYGQLQDLVKGAICQAIQPLQDEVAALREEKDQEIASLRSSLEKSLLESEIFFGDEIARLRQRISKTEHNRDLGKTELSRAEKIQRYLAARPDHKATFETLRGHLGIDKDLLNDAIKALMAASPGRYGIARAPGDKRKRTLVMLPK